MAPILFLIVAFSCTVGAIALSMLHIYRHLLNYMEPTFQRYIIRIIFMVPVYALMSFSSLIRTERSICFSTMREIYESWAISNFLLLCLAWVGGRVAVVEFNGQSLKPSWYLMTCCFLAIPLDGWKFQCGPSLSLHHNYALALVYVACKDLLRPFNPVPKFIIVQSVVFLTYWQGVLVFLAAKSNLIKDAEEAANLNKTSLCVEMLAVSVKNRCAYRPGDGRCEKEQTDMCRKSR
ncbi:hypothetical protein ZIOFF_020788 [Zingiber officinale]|uniref:Uncharacterized protein n=1 Tax=Zingiber officinale TaxID=94328 RepID=A0A8J5H8K9_ZINOF|nr:hypothetical protein ZIOFF_020788 [Zingiber officinale]